MKSIKKLKASLAVLLAMLLTMTPIMGNAAVSGKKSIGNPYSVSLKENAAIPKEAKINAEVKNTLKAEKYAEVLVSLTEQVDSMKVAGETKATLSAKTPYQKKMAGRFAVVERLQETADKTQKDLLKLLETEKAKGNVVEYKSFYIVNMVYVKATEEVINKIAAKNEVKSIELNSKIEIEKPIRNKSDVNSNEVNAIEWGIDKIGAPAVWSGFGVNGSGVTVGIIDTGFDYTHEALKEKWRGYNPANPSAPNPVGNWFDAVAGQTLPYDIPEIPHGSHVSGTILGQDPAQKNIIGVAPGAKFILAKAFTADGGEDAWLLNAGQWMLAPNGNPELAPDIINNSWGGSSGKDEWYRAMVQSWRAAGILPVFSAGNEKGAPAPPASVSNPANYPESFAVAATDINNLRGSFSRRGPAPYAAPFDLKPDISAPGVNVRSSVPGGYEAGWSGTSMAAPHITGTAALLLSYNAALTPDEIENIIRSTATPLTDGDYSSAPNYGYGHGLVNAFNAVSSIATGIGTIQGKVLKPGIDSEDAVIKHEPLKMAYSSILPTLTAEVSDNIMVGAVEAYVKAAGFSYWAQVPMTKVSGDTKNGVYSCDIPGDLLTEPGFQYKIRAYDYGQNITETEVYNVEVKFGITPGQYTTDFSAEPIDWIVNGEWEWGETNTGVAPVGNKLMATVLNGKYTNSKVSSLVAPPIDMRSVQKATLKLKHYYDIEKNYDKGFVAVSNNFGTSWSIKYTFTGSDKQWRDLSISLDEYANSPVPIFVIFQLAPDASVPYDGWYLDDVELLNTSQPAVEIIKTPDVKLDASIIKKNSTPATFKGINIKDIKKESKYFINNEPAGQLGLPLDAVVTIVETGRSVRTSADGSYKLSHAASEEGKEWTLLVESYGYNPLQTKVKLDDKQVINKTFMMTEIGKGSITGQVVNERDNTPIPGATVKLVEDYHVQPVTTDADGFYTIPEAYIGQYTLRVAAPKYYPAEKSVVVSENNATEANFALKPFIGFENEIAYDDGTAENARALLDAGNGWAVRMTPNGICSLKGVNMFIYDQSWPVPGGNRVTIVAYTSNEDGTPGTEVFRSSIKEVVRGQWNQIDLSEYGFSTDKDFYLGMIQVDPNPNCPGIGTDEGSSAGRSFIIVDGGMQPFEESYGNLMIRANVAYAVNAPVISSPASGTFTNKDKILVEGKTNAESLVKLYVNNKVVGEGQTKDKAFSIEIPLTEGENVIKATSVVTAGETDPSLPITVVRDYTAPSLNVTSPVDGMITNKEVVEVIGNVVDTYLSAVKVNGAEVNVNADGSFNSKVIVNEGENIIKIAAIDKAGNTTNVEKKVIVGLVLPSITDITPSNDVTLRKGEEVRVSFRSDAIGGKAGFRILLPVNVGPDGVPSVYPMQEVTPGYYVGKWIAPDNQNIIGAIVEVEIVDIANNKATAQANGKINVVIDKIPPVLNSDLDGNSIGQNIEITFENNTEWINAINGITVDGQSIAGSYTVEPGKIIINGSIFNEGRDYQIAVMADGYKDAMVAQHIEDIILLTPPTLIPATTYNYYGKSISISFVDNPEWKAAITNITVNGQSIAGLYSIYYGKIAIKAGAFTGPGNHTIAVKAEGYEDAVVVQVMRPR